MRPLIEHWTVADFCVGYDDRPQVQYQMEDVPARVVQPHLEFGLDINLLNYK